MKKNELIEKMKVDLLHYQVGLHNIGINKYKSVMRNYGAINSLFRITDGIVSEETIASQIMKTGLNVLDRPFGLRSTVMPIRELNDNSLDYTYNQVDEGPVWNVIVGIPYYFEFEGEKYYLGDIGDFVNVANMLLFNPNLAREFIYGYYSGRIVKIYESECGFKFEYDDEVDFYGNPSFYGILASEDRNLVLKRIFEQKKRVLTTLKLANNDNKMGMLFRTSFERHVIRETRKQVKTLKYGQILNLR